MVVEARVQESARLNETVRAKERSRYMSEETIRCETDLWSLNPGNGRSITARLSETETGGFAELDLRWDNGMRVKGPIKLTPIDLENLAKLVLEFAAKAGIDIRAPLEN